VLSSTEDHREKKEKRKKELKAKAKKEKKNSGTCYVECCLQLLVGDNYHEVHESRRKPGTQADHENK
jgi:hypothetical protein